MEGEIGSLEYVQDIEKLLESENIKRAIFIQMALQMMIQRISVRETLGDALMHILGKNKLSCQSHKTLAIEWIENTLGCLWELERAYDLIK